MSDSIVIPDFDSEEVDAGISTAEAQQGLSVDELNAAQQEIEMEEKYGDRGTEAAALGAASGLSFGLSNNLLKKLGYTEEELREIDDRNKAASIVGETVGTVGSLFTPTGIPGRVLGTAGKAVRGVVKAGEVTEKATAKMLNKLIAETGERKFAKEVIKKAIPKAAGSAVEGAAFGAGQLIKEDALGTADFNAENLVTAVGGGALLGGALGAGLGASMPLFSPAIKVGSKVKDSVSKKIAGFSNAEDAALDLLGTTTTQRINFKKFNPQLVADLPEFLTKEAGLGKYTSTDALYENILKLKDTAGKKIPSVLKQIDEAAIVNPSLLPSKQQVFDPILQTLDDKYIKKYAGKNAFRGQLRKVRQIRDDINNVRFGDQPLSATFLQDLRKQADELAKFEKTPGKITMGEEAARDVRQALRSEIDNLAERVSGMDPKLSNLSAELKRANKNFSIASQIEKPLVKKVNKPDQIASLTDLVTGGLVGSFGLDAIAGTIGVKKFLESDFRRRLSILSYMEKKNQTVENQLKKGIKNFFKSSVKPTDVAVKSILVKSDLAEKVKDGKLEKPKDKQAAFKNIRSNIIELATNPEKMEERLIRSTAGLSRVAPETASSAQAIMVRSVAFLKSKLPAEVYSMEGLKALQRERQISELELSKFTRYLEAIQSPMVLLEDLQNGTATREQVEAVRTVYPDLYKRIQEETYEYLATEDQVSYTKKVQLGILLGIDTDSSLRKDALRDLQGRFRVEEVKQEEQRSSAVSGSAGPSKLTVSGTKNLNMAERENSQAQAFTRRRQN